MTRFIIFLLLSLQVTNGFAVPKDNVPASKSSNENAHHAKDHQAAEHGINEEEESGIPGDDEIIELLHLAERMREYDNPIWPFLVTASFSFLSVHALIHSIHEARHQRRELIMESEHAGHTLHEKQKLLEKIKAINTSLEVDHRQLQKLHQEAAELFVELKERGKRLKGDARADFDKVLNHIGPKPAFDSKSFETVDRWLKSPNGQSALKDSSVKKWADQYRETADKILEDQRIFLRDLEGFDRTRSDFDGSKPTYYRLVEEHGPNAKVQEEDAYGRPQGGGAMPRKQVLQGVKRQTEACGEAYNEMVAEHQHEQSKIAGRRYYTSPTFMRGVRYDAGVSAISGLLAGGSYMYFRSKSGGEDAFHHELERRLRFAADWNAKSDILTQLSSQEGQHDLQPVLDAVFDIVNSPKFSGRLRDQAKKVLEKKALGTLANEEYLSRIEDRSKVNVASTVGFSVVARDVGAWYITKAQLFSLLRGGGNDDPQYREMFIDNFVERLPGWIWPATRNHSFDDEVLKQEMVSALSAELDRLHNEGQLQLKKKHQIPLPGQIDHGH